MVRTYWLVQVFNEASWNLGLQPDRTDDQVESNSAPCYVRLDGSRGALSAGQLLPVLLCFSSCTCRASSCVSWPRQRDASAASCACACTSRTLPAALGDVAARAAARPGSCGWVGSVGARRPQRKRRRRRERHRIDARHQTAVRADGRASMAATGRRGPGAERVDREGVGDRGRLGPDREVLGQIGRADVLDRDVGDRAAAPVQRGAAGVVGVRRDHLVGVRVDLGVGDPGEGLLVGVERRDELGVSPAARSAGAQPWSRAARRRWCRGCWAPSRSRSSTIARVSGQKRSAQRGTMPPWLWPMIEILRPARAYFVRIALTTYSPATWMSPRRVVRAGSPRTREYRAR